jgi:hypothetical protein
VTAQCLDQIKTRNNRKARDKDGQNLMVSSPYEYLADNTGNKLADKGQVVIQESQTQRPRVVALASCSLRWRLRSGCL